MCKKNIYRLCNVKRLEQNIKSRCNPHFWNAWKLKCSTARVICTCDKRDSAFCALQLTALIKPNWCVVLYCCACLHPNTIWKTGRTTVPYTNLSILICNSSAKTKKSVICVALRTHLEIRLGICIYKTSLLQGVSQLLKQSDWTQIQDFKWYHNDDYIYWKVKR